MYMNVSNISKAGRGINRIISGPITNCCNVITEHCCVAFAEISALMKACKAKWAALVVTVMLEVTGFLVQDIQ